MGRRRRRPQKVCQLNIGASQGLELANGSSEKAIATLPERCSRCFASSALLLAENRMGEKIFEDVVECLESAGLMMLRRHNR